MDTGHFTPSTETHFYELQAWKYYYIATYTLLIWDWLTMLPDEVERIWQRTRNSFTVLWVLIRYLPIVMYTNATFVVFQRTWEPETCRKFATSPTIFVISLVLITHVVFLLRTYALYGKSRTILAVLIPCWFAEAGVLIWTAFDERLTFLPKGFGCVPASPRRIQGVVTWSAPFIYDCMICALTLRKSLQYRRDNNDVAIIQIVLRDGLIYFAVMFTCYFANIFIYLLAPEGLQDINAGFSTSITVIMTCRLILNLRTPRPGSTATADYPSRSGVSFLSKPSELLSTFLTEIGQDLNSEFDRRHQTHDYQLQDVQDGPLSRRRGTPYVV